MARAPLSKLDGKTFDIVVIGGGVTGASAAQHLTAAGYDILLVEKADFGSGSSSRSGRMAPCGIRYLEPGDGLAYLVPGASPLWQFLRRPDQFIAACRKAREASWCRSDFVKTMPSRVEANTWFYPLWKQDKYAPWHVNIGFKLLWLIGSKDVPLDAGQLSPRAIGGVPLAQWLRDPEDLRGVFQFREYRFEWPERIVMDTVLDTERMGGAVRNYTEVSGMHRGADGAWTLDLTDRSAQGGHATVRARAVMNATGIWIDRVNRLAKPDTPRKITGTKGTHIMVQLPPECRTFGIITSSRDGNPFYIYPWRGMHYVGPTDTIYDGDEDIVTATEDEIAFLISEANHLLPAADLKRRDVLFTWAGVRPQTHDPQIPSGRRGRQFHDLAGDGLPNVYALTGGNIILHRLAGMDICREMRRRFTPSGAPQPLSYAEKPYPRDEESPPLLNHWPEARLSDLRHAATHEHAITLQDLMFRRVGAGWTSSMGREAARKAAETVADILGWDAARVDAEVSAYLAHIERFHGVSATS